MSCTEGKNNHFSVSVELLYDYTLINHHHQRLCHNDWDVEEGSLAERHGMMDGDIWCTHTTIWVLRCLWQFEFCLLRTTGWCNNLCSGSHPWGNAGTKCKQCRARRFGGGWRWWRIKDDYSQKFIIMVEHLPINLPKIEKLHTGFRWGTNASATIKPS